MVRAWVRARRADGRRGREVRRRDGPRGALGAGPGRRRCDACDGETVRAVRLVRVGGVGRSVGAGRGRRRGDAWRRAARNGSGGARTRGRARQERRGGRVGGGGARGGAGRPESGRIGGAGRPESGRIGGEEARSAPGAGRAQPGGAPARPACNPEARPGEPRGGGRRGGQDLARAHPERDQLRAEWRRPRNPVGSDLIRKAARIRVPRSGDRGGGRGQVARRRPGIAPAGARERPESAADPRAVSAAARPESTNRPPEDPAQGFLEVNPKSSRSRGPARAGGGPGIAAAGRARARPRVLGRLRRATRRANAKTRERRARAAEPGEKFFEPRFRPVKRTRALLPTCSILTRSGQRARR